MFYSRWFAVFSCLAAVFLFSSATVVQAKPTFSGGNCSASGCHGGDPSKAHVQAPGTFQGVPTFDVTLTPGTTSVNLQEIVGDTLGGNYSVALMGPITGAGTSRTDFVSLISGNIAGLNDSNNKLLFTTDSTWTSKTTTYPTGGVTTTWNYVGPNAATTGATINYNMQVSDATPSDYYALTFQTAGSFFDDATSSTVKWSAPEKFYIHVLPAVPEPSTLLLLGFGVVGFLVWRRR